MADKGVEVVVRFDPSIGADAQGPAMLMLEGFLRDHTGLDVRVVKDVMADEVKSRRAMTIEVRSKL